MSNSYLCDSCVNDHPMYTVLCYDVTDCFQYGERQKVVVPDGYKGDPTRLCLHWKERA